MIENFAVVIYTHTDCQDVYEVFFKQLEKHFNITCKKYICINDDFRGLVPKDIPNEYNLLLYPSSIPYASKLSYCLSKVEESTILYLHEDMILYDNIDETEFIKYIKYIQSQDRDSFIKLIKGGEKRDIPHESISTLKRIPIDSEWIFSVQPSIWKKNKLRFLCASLSNCDIYQLENLSQKFCRENGIEGNYSYQGEPERGGHYDCKVFPYIATAIVRGKWNTKEYAKELIPILEEHGIDKNIRGEF